MLKTGISVVMIVQDCEEAVPNAIRSCMAFADEVVAIDGGSDDATVEVCREHGCVVYENPWPGYWQQREFGVAHASNDWIFFIDADEVADRTLSNALCNWKRSPSRDWTAYTVARRGDFLGRWLPSRERLVRFFDRRCSHVSQTLVHEEVVSRRIGDLEGTLLHYGFRSIADHVSRFNRYTTLDAEKAYSELGKRYNPIRLVVKPIARLGQKLFVQRLVTAGLPGIAVAGLWAYYDFLTELKLFEHDLRTASRHGNP